MSGIVRANNTSQSGIVTNTETIDSDDYVDASIDNAHLANDAVGADELASDAVVNASIASSAAIDATKIANGTVTSTEFQYINSLSSNAQTQISAKAAVGSSTPSTQAHGDSAATGSSAEAARVDHKHAMPAAGGPSQAAQSDVLAETNQDTYVPPDLIRYSPGVAKVWAKWNSGTHASLTYNMSSLSDGSSAAETDHVFNDDFTSVDWAFTGSALDNGSFVYICGLKDGTDVAGGMTTINRGADTGTADLNDVSMSIHGIQVV
jgi:hypothetical protein